MIITKELTIIIIIIIIITTTTTTTTTTPATLIQEHPGRGRLFMEQSGGEAELVWIIGRRWTERKHVPRWLKKTHRLGGRDLIRWNPSKIPDVWWHHSYNFRNGYVHSYIILEDYSISLSYYYINFPGGICFLQPISAVVASRRWTTRQALLKALSASSPPGPNPTSPKWRQVAGTQSARGVGAVPVN